MYDYDEDLSDDLTDGEIIIRAIVIVAIIISAMLMCIGYFA